MSLDGYLDSAAPTRLALSNDADFDRVDAVRASCDAILVGAATVRTDNPRLLVAEFYRRTESQIAPWHHAQVASDRMRFAEISDDGSPRG